MLKLRLSIGLAAAALALASATSALAEYPERPVSIIVPWGAGGGADTITRIYAIGLEKELGVPINVVNRTGGNGVVGHSAIMSAKPDGYTLGLCTSEITYFKTIGLGDITPANFDLLSRLALIPAGVTVAANAPFGDMKSFAEAVKSSKKGSYIASGSGLGGPWHMAVAGYLKAAGMPADQIKFVASQGGAPALQDLVAGGITVFTGSPVEAKALAEAGEVKVLAIMADEPSEAFPGVPTIKDATGTDWSLANWFSLCAPAGLPEDVKATLVEKGKAAHEAEPVQSALKERGITSLWDGPEAFGIFAGEFSETAADILKDVGLAK
ncbi:Bug family tripartite tricarboxylate transporter substrate binding protein [Sinorhizobium arboris]|uniref:Bug family tripartite tricarboxylate transporter substrate binding protein n=1 Tax=Sinorhizobium arboris TaxID=76745 RepID=UPI00041FADFA|nr:tripartite tricarboxylate transporter substrate binding protein [Sinorhizobium arboris]